ncbi:MAG: trigger factor [Oscillospiraceae bacterium]|nr:trigger factor [Oscillospiraceae bacterium]
MSLVNTNKTATNTYELEIEVSAEKFEEAVQQAFMRAKNKINVPGFRKGKAPRKIIEREYGEAVFYEDAVNILYPAEVDAAVNEANLDLVAQPEVEITDVSKENGVKIKVVCTTKPEVAISDYLGIEVEKVVNAVTDEDVDKEVDRIREKNVRIINIDDRAAQMGDDVVIDFEGFKDGVAFEGGKAEKFELSLGSGQFIPGFEEKVAGHNIGEEFDIDVTFPEDYASEELKGAAVIFKIKLHEIKGKELPELDDEFVKDTSEFDTVADFKADVKAKLEKAAEDKADAEFEQKLFDAVVEKMEAEIPDVMFENRAREMAQEMNSRLASQGISFEMYCQFTGQTPESVIETFKKQAEPQVKLRLALEKIVELEKIEASDDEANAEIQKIADAYKMEVEQVKQYIAVEDVKKDVCVGKAVDLIKESAKVK